MPTVLFGRIWEQHELRDRVSDMSQLASVRRSELAEGKGRGAEQVQVELADGFSLSVLPGYAYASLHASTHTSTSAHASSQSRHACPRLRLCIAAAFCLEMCSQGCWLLTP